MQAIRPWLWSSIAAVALLAPLGCGSGPDSPAPESADPARQVAERVMQALGGEEAWAQARHLRFTFFGNRTHHWDRWTGRHRLEGTSQEGESYVVLHNVQSREGEAHVDGRRLEAGEAEPWLERAYRAWVNDTYWLIMPYKLQDPGVVLSYEGAERIAEQEYDVLHLRFENVGLTPGDQYWAYVNRETGLMDRWAYLLESMDREETPTAWDWSGWQRYGGIMLAPDRTRVGDGRHAELSNIAVFDDLPDSVYTSSIPPETP